MSAEDIRRDAKKRAEIRQVVDKFRNQPVTAELLEAYCKRHGIDYIGVGDFSDYKYQVEHDEKVSAMYPEILAELQNLAYIPEFAPAKEREAIKERNDEVRVNITKLFEKHAIDYKTADSLGNEIGQDIGGKVASAGTTAFNKALEVLLHLAHKHFGGEFNLKHVADYAQEVFDNAEKNKNSSKKDTAGKKSKQGDKDKL